MNDEEIAKMYLAKIQSSKDRKVDFELPFNEYKRLINTKFCGYTGIEFCDYENNIPKDRNRGRTIDRLDNTKGYISGNCVAVCNAANHIKSLWEDPQNPITEKLTTKILANINRRKQKCTN